MMCERNHRRLLRRIATQCAMLFCVAIAFAPVQAVCQASNAEVIDFEQEEGLLEKATETRGGSDADDASGEPADALIRPASDVLPCRCVDPSLEERNWHNGFGGWLRL